MTHGKRKCAELNFTRKDAPNLVVARENYYGG